MKNQFLKCVLFLFCTSLLMVGCSNEPEVNSNNQSVDISKGNDLQSNVKSRSGSNLERYYNEMLASESYKIFNSDNKNFIRKMNTEDDLSGIANERDFQRWLSSNISRTLFVNYNDANTHFERLKSQYVRVIAENRNFFMEAENNPNFGNDFPQILQPIDTPIMETNNCIFECINDGVACDRASRENYAAQMGGSGLSYFYNPILAAGAAIVATVIYNNAQSACVRTLNRCVGGCK